MPGLPEHCLLFRQTRVNPLKSCDSIPTIIDESGYIPAGCGHQSQACYPPGLCVPVTPRE